VVFKHVQDPLPPARSINPDLPEAVELVILKTLAKNPEDRYQTAGDLVRAIQMAIPEVHAATPATVVHKPAGEQASAAATSGQVMPATMIAKPKRGGVPVWVWGVIGVVLLAVIAGGGFILFGRGTAPSNSPAVAATAKMTATPAKVVATAVPSPTPVPSNALIATGKLPAGGQMLSGNKLYRFEVLPEGALKLFDNYTNRLLWSSYTKGDAKELIIQNDGNLVLVAKDGSIIWASNKTGKPGDYFLALQDDGNLVVYQGIYQSKNVKPIWASNTAR
jgi:hypothetical protein